MGYMPYMDFSNIFTFFICFWLIWGPDKRWGARASSVNANLTRRIDPYCPEDSESPSRMILMTFDFHFCKYGPGPGPNGTQMGRAQMGPKWAGPKWAGPKWRFHTPIGYAIC